MSFKNKPDLKNTDPSPEEESIYANWCALAGTLLGLAATVLIGHWISNLVLFGTGGYIIGALIDRRKK